MKDEKQFIERYKDLRSLRTEWISIWEDIGRYCSVTKQDFSSVDSEKRGQVLDYEINDSTSYTAISQAGDAMQGIVWGSGKNAFRLVPTDDVLDRVRESEVQDYYKFATDETLKQMNHAGANLIPSMQSYFYDQVSFGTSGIGVFLDENPHSDNKLLFRPYGVDTMCVAEGANGFIEVVYVTYSWRLTRIIRTFAYTDGEIDKKKYAKLPMKFRDAWEKNRVNDKFTIVCGVSPQDDYKAGTRGRRSARYIGGWFEPDGEEVFYTEYYRTMPIAVGRYMLYRGETYGRSSGTNILSSIRNLNYVVGDVFEAIEKTVRPPLGLVNGSLVGDNIVDTSADSLSVVKSAEGGSPVFPLLDVGDPSNAAGFMIPYLREQITSAFKIDVLLDFNSSKQMTATESMQRYSIRAKALSGSVMRQRIEVIDRLVDRSVDLLYHNEMLGVDSSRFPSEAKMLIELQRQFKVIPDVILQLVAEGKRWYKIEYNNEISKMNASSEYEAMSNLLMFMQPMNGMYPEERGTFKTQKIREKMVETLNMDSDLIMDEDEYKDMREAMAQQQAMQASMAMGNAQSETNKNNAKAEKDVTDAQQ